MNNRIKELRSNLGLSAEKFGARVGVTRSAISRIENGVVNVTEQMQKSVCREFNVSEEWLRTGTGGMYIERTANQEVFSFTNNVMNDGDESFKKRFMVALSKLDENDWLTLEKIALELKK